MRALIRAGRPAAGEQISPDQLHRCYADDWLPDGGVRANFVTSIDGAVAIYGLSRGLQTPGDNKVFAVQRDLADVVLVGAATAHAERYRQPPITEQRRAVRRAFGLPDRLRVALLSRSLDIDVTVPLLADPLPDDEAATRPLILTCASAGDTQVRQALAPLAEVIDCGDEDLDLAIAIEAVRTRGMTRMLCEGGPRLFGAFAEAGLIDELCLSVTPVLVGPTHKHLVAGEQWPAGDQLRTLTLHTTMEEDGALFHRYRRTGHPQG